MKKVVLTSLIIFLFGVFASSQPNNPGFERPRIWINLTHSDSIRAEWVTNSGTLDIIPFEQSLDQLISLRFLNFNPARPILSGGIGLQMPTELSKMTIIAVYQSEDNYLEKAIWSLYDKNFPSLILTTARAADLIRFRYFNAEPQRVGVPRISTFSQYLKEDSQKSMYQTLVLGAKPQAVNLPVIDFRGVIPEIMIYDRVLNATERTCAESYLALKYGITLYQNGPSRYLNSKGEVIWDGYKNTPAFFNIAGVGRDDGSGLFQKQSSSSYQPSLLAIGLKKIAASNQENDGSIPDNHFLIWGDNGAGLEFIEGNDGQTATLKRRWIMSGFGRQSNTLSTAISFDFAATRQPEDSLSLFWLVIDRSGTGNYSRSSLDLIQADMVTDDGKAVFKNVFWDIDGSGKDAFTFSKSVKIPPPSWEFKQVPEEGPRDDKLKDNFENLLLYPNPVSKDHFFNLEIGLNKRMPVQINTYDGQGRLIQNRLLEGSSYYFYSAQINVPGMYNVILKSEGVQKTLQLVVE